MRQLILFIILFFVTTLSFSQSKFDTIYYRKYHPLVNFGIQNNYHNILINGINFKTVFPSLTIGQGIAFPLSKKIEINGGINLALDANYSLSYANGRYYTQQNLSINNQDIIYRYSYLGAQAPFNLLYKSINTPLYYQIGFLYEYNIANNFINHNIKFNNNRFAVGLGLGTRFKFGKANGRIDLRYLLGTNILQSSTNNLFKIENINTNLLTLNFIAQSNYYLKNKKPKKKLSLSKIIGDRIK